MTLCLHASNFYIFFSKQIKIKDAADNTRHKNTKQIKSTAEDLKYWQTKRLRKAFLFSFMPCASGTWIVRPPNLPGFQLEY